MQKTVLITGGFGFLGRAVAHKFKLLGYRIAGIGRGRWSTDEALAHGFDVWLNASISLSSLMTMSENFDLVVHCGGNGSVGYSLANPLQDFSKTVQGTIELLEFLRVTGSKALLVYPSSAGVYGAKEDAPIKETDALNPISPYGFHKRIAEELIESYSKSYGIRSVVIRFFSIYGPGLTKQLLWDASAKLLSAGSGQAVFWGTGDETRDWIYIDDATELISHAAKFQDSFKIINGASGVRVTVSDTLNILRDALGSSAKISFNRIVKVGDPHFYHSDMQWLRDIAWKPETSLQKGVSNYVIWFNGLSHD